MIEGRPMLTRPFTQPLLSSFLLATCLLSTAVYGQNDDNKQSSTLEANSVPEQDTQQSPPRIRKISLQGVRVIRSEKVREAVEKSVLGKPATLEVQRMAAEAVVAAYRKQKYSVAQVVDISLSPEGDLTLGVAEGIIQRIRVEGNRRTRTRTILASLTLQAGDAYREDRADADRQRLARLGIFADVKIGAEAPKPAAPEAEKAPPKPVVKEPGVKTDPVPPKVEQPQPEPPPLVPPISPVTEEIGTVDLVVRIQEQPTFNVAATVGYSDGSGAVGFVDLTEDNLLGTANRAAIQWQRSSQARFRDDGSIEQGDSRMAFSVAYNAPPLGFKSLGYSIELYDKNTVFLPFFTGAQDTIRSYEQRRGARGQVGKQISDVLSVFATARRDQVGYDAVPNDLNPPYEALTTAAGTVSALGIALVADGRDAADNPRRGYRHSLRVERAGSLFGGNRNFTQGTLDLRAYLPLSRSASTNRKKAPPVFAMRFLGGTSSGDVPLSEQFFLGGFELLRGYDLFSIRGDRALLTTGEVRLPLGQGLQGVVFTDVGGAWVPGAKVSLNELKASFGVGVRFLSPIGPIRLDAAYGSRFQTYISLGQSF
jgi:outer membrane protein insertion porin family